MDFLTLAKDRYSVRKFDGRPLTDDEIGKILEAARLAPTAKNNQPQRICLLKSEEALARLSECTKSTYGTKTAFLVSYDERESWKRDTDGVDSGYVDASIVATHMMLEAASIGVGSTWVMWFDAGKAKELFSLPETVVPVALLVMGYPAPTPEALPSPRHTLRKDLSEIVTEL